LAGHLGLGRLVYVYDDNHITIDGPTELSYTDDVPKRFESYGWHVDNIGEAANDTEALETALRGAMAEEDRPSLIVLRSHIGYPSPKYTDTAAAHGNPLGADEIKVTKEILGLPPEESFWVPPEVLEMYRQCIPRGRALRQEWQSRLDAWDGDREVLEVCLNGRGLKGWDAKLPTFEAGTKLATRKASGQCLNAVADVVPGLLAGGADLTDNTGTFMKDQGVQSAADPGGRLIYFGIREHGMGGIMNGAALHGGVVPVGGTFFIFSDYMRPSVRLAAVSEAKVIYSWTHDSVGLGEDGPTHQPVEQIAAMRAMPGLRVVRPADANETAHAWRVAIDSNGPTALLLSRQDLPVLEGTAGAADDVARGAYVLRPGGENLDLVLIGTGSEVHVCLAAADLLAADGIDATQATVSRDLDELGALKVRVPGGDTVYALPEPGRDPRTPEDHLRRVLGEWVVEVASSANLVGVRTPPGSAHVVGSAIDRAGLDGALGTVAGDDTVLVVAAERPGGPALARRLARLAGLDARG
ncbi:MAG: transketolase-like TK C-terminal-containing protein, partial [Acidimicrobiales bacterium]